VILCLGEFDSKYTASVFICVKNCIALNSHETISVCLSGYAQAILSSKKISNGWGFDIGILCKQPVS